MSQTLSLTTFGPAGASPTAGLLAWLGSVWKQLRESLAASTLTKHERELIHLFEFAGSRFGDPILNAADEDALDDRLDELLESSDVLHMVALFGQLAMSMRPPHSVSLEPLTTAVAKVVGEEPTQQLNRAGPLLEAWFVAQRDVLKVIPLDELPADLGRPWADPEVPVEIAEAGAHGLRMSLCFLAIVRALSSDTVMSPWLALALVHRLVVSAGIHLRLLASFPGVVVSEEIIPKAERIDLASVETRHARARIAAQRSLAEARTRLGS